MRAIRANNGCVMREIWESEESIKWASYRALTALRSGNKALERQWIYHGDLNVSFYDSLQSSRVRIGTLFSSSFSCSVLLANGHS